MKKIVYSILFTTFFLFSSNVFAWKIEYNTESNIKKAILVENYIVKHKSKIGDFIKKYNISSSTLLENDINELNESIEALKQIQNTDIEKVIAEEVMQAIILRVKNVNDSLKTKLKAKKEEFEKKLKKKKEIYSRLWVKLSDKIDNINIKIATNIFKDKKVLSLKESKIKLNLIKLNKESLKLRNFWNIHFKSEKEIKDSFIRILKNIKREIWLMKETIK